MLLRIVVEAEAEDPQGVKKSLAMALERYAPARVVEVAPVYRQRRMAGAPVTGIDILAGIPTEGVVGPFARSDAALRAAVEANEEIRG